MSITFVFLIRWLGRIWNACLVVVGILEITGPSDVVRPAPFHHRAAAVGHASAAEKFATVNSVRG